MTPDPSPCCIVCFHSAIGYGAVNCVIIYLQVLKAMTSHVSVDCTDADVDSFFFFYMFLNCKSVPSCFLGAIAWMSDLCSGVCVLLFCNEFFIN